jgi:hypothetical protein
VGLFCGAPLNSRELEHGTHRLVWTQGVSRQHWALIKFTLIGGTTLAVATGYGLGMSWWLNPVSQTGSSRFNPLGFDLQGVAPIGNTLFAVALGIFAGTIWQKVLPAMAVTLAGFVGLRIALTVLARPRYLTPETLTFPRPERRCADQPVQRRLGPVPGDPRRGRQRGAGQRAGCLHPGRDVLRSRSGRRRRQLADVPTRGPFLALPGHRNEHPPRPRRVAGLSRVPPDPPDCLTTPVTSPAGSDALTDDRGSSHR